MSESPIVTAAKLMDAINQELCDRVDRISKERDQWRELAGDLAEVLWQSDTTYSYDKLREKALSAYEKLKGSNT